MGGQRQGWPTVHVLQTDAHTFCLADMRVRHESILYFSYRQVAGRSHTGTMQKRKSTWLCYNSVRGFGVLRQRQSALQQPNSLH